MTSINYKIKTANENKISSHLHDCNNNFSQPLNQRVNIEEYAKKIFDKAITFEAWDQEELIGLVAAYFNDASSSSGYITNVSVNKNFVGKGIATALMSKCLDHAKERSIKDLSLEVSLNNDSAIRFYKKFGFKETEIRENSVLMHRL